MNLCKHKDFFGKPKEGLHSYRIFDLAIIDIIFTILGAYIISYFSKQNFYITLAILFLIGIVLHRIFCVKTTLDKIIF